MKDEIIGFVVTGIDEILAEARYLRPAHEGKLIALVAVLESLRGSGHNASPTIDAVRAALPDGPFRTGDIARQIVNVPAQNVSSAIHSLVHREKELTIVGGDRRGYVYQKAVEQRTES